MATSAGHVRKRQFQPSNQTSLNSYFSRSSNASVTNTATTPLSPPLPPETQASLLSVGMRVRKSVPEGYKTHKTLGTPGFPFPSSAPAASAPASTRPVVDYKTISTATRELIPFCGLHKTGGLAAQLPPPSSAPAVLIDGVRADEDYDFEERPPSLTMSQSTLPLSQDSVTSPEELTNRRKRSFEDEIEDDLDAYFDSVDSAENISYENRPIARHKNSSRKSLIPRALNVRDFEDASFLAPIEGMDVDH